MLALGAIDATSSGYRACTFTYLILNFSSNVESTSYIVGGSEVKIYRRVLDYAVNSLHEPFACQIFKFFISCTGGKVIILYRPP